MRHRAFWYKRTACFTPLPFRLTLSVPRKCQHVFSGLHVAASRKMTIAVTASDIAMTFISLWEHTECAKGLFVICVFSDYKT